MAKLCKFPTRIPTLANQAGVNVSKTKGGRWRITSRANRGYIGTVDTEDEVRNVLRQLVDKNAPDIDGGLAVPGNGVAINANPLQPQAQLTGFRKLTSLLQAGPLAFLTPMKNFAQAVEKLGKGQPFSKVYEPTQRAIQEVNNAMAGAAFKNKALGNRTFQEAIVHDLEKRVVRLNPEDQQKVTLWLEAHTKEEIAQKLSLDQTNIAAADALSQTGLAEEIPVLMRLNAIVDEFLMNRNKTVNQLIPQMRNDILEGKLPQELLPELDRLQQTAGDFDNFSDVVKSLGLSKEEQTAMLMLRTLSSDEKYNIPAIFSYATAPKLEKGFKNGREMFAAKRGMSPEALAIAKERAVILGEAFKQYAPGADMDLILGVHLPTFRQFIDAGVFPGMEPGGGTTATVGRLAKMLKEGLPEGGEVLTRRVLSGHVNPYELHPSVTAYKHVRNLVLRDKFDSVADAAKDAIGNVPDARSRRILTEYMHELEGLPGESFKRVTDAIRTLGRFAGYPVDDRLAERTTALLTRLSYQASIPFRPALILRNYTQTLFFTAPVVGPKSWGVGLKYATSRETAQAAFEEAVRAGAIDPNTTPLFDASRVFGIEAGRFSDKFGPELASVGFKVNELFELGFSAYRKADDWGRAVAFHAGKDKVNTHLGKFIKGEIDMERLKELAKVKTFDETIEAEFERLVLSPTPGDAASYIGKQLADKTHLLYGNANHPAGWGGVAGRLFGQFGTFPVQYANFVLDGLSRGTMKDRAEFLAMHSALNMGVIVAGDELFDLDLQSWATLPSLTYTGGPYAELAYSLYAMMGGSDAERALARRNVALMFPTFENPASIFLPGSYFIGDLADAFGQDDLLKAVAEGGGFRFLKPTEETSVDKIFSWMD